MVRLQHGTHPASFADGCSSDRDRLHERHTEVHKLAVQIPALRELAGNLLRDQRLSPRVAARRLSVFAAQHCSC